MIRLLSFILIISVGFNIYFYQRRLENFANWEEKKKLHYYKKISYEQGYAFFRKEVKKNYPEINLQHKYFVVYRWDSIYYDAIYREQMKALDSMANHFGKYSLEYFFVTEMKEGDSRNYLKRNSDEYKNVKMLFEMDDFTSGLHNIKGLTMIKPILTYRRKQKSIDSSIYLTKQLNFYTIIDEKGTVLFTNKIGRIVKDTAFLKKLKDLIPYNNLKILN